MLKLTTDKHKASRGLSATAELLVILKHSTYCYCVMANTDLQQETAVTATEKTEANPSTPHYIRLNVGPAAHGLRSTSAVSATC